MAVFSNNDKSGSSYEKFSRQCPPARNRVNSAKDDFKNRSQIGSTEGSSIRVVSRLVNPSRKGLRVSEEQQSPLKLGSSGMGGVSIEGI